MKNDRQTAIVFSYKGGGSAHLGAFVNTGNDHAGKNAAEAVLVEFDDSGGKSHGNGLLECDRILFRKPFCSFRAAVIFDAES